MNRGLFLWLRVAVAGLFGCVKAEELRISVEDHPDWTELSNRKYALKHPEGVLVDRSGLSGAELVIFLEKPPVLDRFSPNINLQIQDLQGQKVSLDRYTEISLDQVDRLIANSKVIANSRKKGKKGEYHLLMYTGEQGVYHLQFEQYFAIAHGKAYVLTLTCEQASFERCKGTGEAIMNTFALK
ncbi:MAG: hypothetical protein IPN71_11230 [Fibrobacteres bacterium]|nr:hypothetical protein [Fibrobacterota bacterium]